MAIKMISWSGINSLVETDKYGMTPVHYASCEPHLLRLLVSMAKPQFFMKRDDMGNTPLHYAVMYGCSGSLNVLAPLCDLINIKNNKGCTPLHLSVKQPNMLRALLQYQKCSINETDNDGKTALHKAFECWNVECVQALLQDKRCDPNILFKNEHCM